MTQMAQMRGTEICLAWIGRLYRFFTVSLPKSPLVGEAPMWMPGFALIGGIGFREVSRGRRSHQAGKKGSVGHPPSRKSDFLWLFV